MFNDLSIRAKALLAVALAFAAVPASMAVFPAPFLWLPLPLLGWLFYRTCWKPLRETAEEHDDARQSADWQQRIINCLTAAMTAKHHSQPDHLDRVQSIAVEIGHRMNLKKTELRVLSAAAVLRDIGLLAVPEQIIRKNGRLAQEEYDRVKIHPIVAADVVERAGFNAPVAAVVRSHHEMWNGGGYPDGLKGETIPLGARILAVAESFAAMTTDRPYGRAMPPSQALQFISTEACARFDPSVVEALAAYLKAASRSSEALAASPGDNAFGCKADNFLSSITEARRESQAVFELNEEIGNSLCLNDVFHTLSTRLGNLLAFDCMSVYLLRDGLLIPEYVQGDDKQVYLALEIPVGQGVSGYAAKSGKPVLNGNPLMEFAHLGEPIRVTSLRSALAVPLIGSEDRVGVITLYRAGKNAFRKDDLRIMQGVRTKLTAVLNNALKYRTATASASTDYLTGLPNTRSLFLHLDAELARGGRLGGVFSVLVCDLDGFKRVNDQLGHLEGNRLLCEVSRTLQESCREYDYVARMGGDEFVIVLPGLDQEETRVKAESLRRSVIEAATRCCPEVRVGMSTGAATYPRDGADAEQLLAVADQRMYDTKQRNSPVPERMSIQGVGLLNRYSEVTIQ